MKKESISDRFFNLERLFLALADRTRLRLLNLMRAGEICVFSFTEVLGESQPKISRHLAYLRNARIVTARRDGKWVYYSISTPDDHVSATILRTTLTELENWPEMLEERRRYETLCSSPVPLAKTARTQTKFISENTNILNEPTAQSLPLPSHNDLDDFLL
ncbi:MAG: ArsR family transcriptional regulator [Blastocatellia bacterium]